MQFTTLLLSTITAALAGLTTASPLVARDPFCAYAVAASSDILSVHACVGLTQITCDGLQTCLTAAGAVVEDNIIDVVQEVPTDADLTTFLACATSYGVTCV